MNNQQLATMGQQAGQILSNPAWEEAWRRMDAEIHAAWVGSDVRDAEGQRLLLQQAKLVNRLKSTMAESWSIMIWIDFSKDSRGEIVPSVSIEMRNRLWLVLSPTRIFSTS